MRLHMLRFMNYRVEEFGSAVSDTDAYDAEPLVEIGPCESGVDFSEVSIIAYGNRPVILDMEVLLDHELHQRKLH